VTRRSFTLRAQQPYCLRTALHGHGWIDLPPHRWDAQREHLDTAIEVIDQGVDLRIRHRGGDLQVHANSERPLGREGMAQLRHGLTRMLRLDVDLREFWKLCRKSGRLAWVDRLRAGHLMQSTELFEDLLKLLFTTNCSWAATKKMTSRLVEALGKSTPSRQRCFPSARTCAARNEAFYRDVVRAGYRARACVQLAEGFASGEISEATILAPPGDLKTCRERLLSLPGFGPYAVGQALRGLGYYRDLALDSWCRSRLTEMAAHSKTPSDRVIERRYAGFGAYRGLALWMDLTAHWHGR